jgi:membrane protein
VTDDDTTGNGGRLPRLASMLAAFGLIVLGFLAGNATKKPRGRVRRWIDGVLRRLLFQSTKENPATEDRSAASLIGEVTARVYRRFMDHNIMSVAAAGAFFIVLAIFPGLAGLVALYGFLGDPADISAFISAMPDIIPDDIVRLVQNFLQQLISRPNTNLGTFLIGFSIALWSSNSAMKSLIESLNVVYERPETRSILALNGFATIMTLAFLGFMVVAVNIMILPVWDWLLQSYGDRFLRMRWVALLFAMQVLISALYYFAPCGRQQRWQLLTAGATLAALSWVLMSMLFSLYLTNFANYSVAYGSLGAMAVFMTWLWLTVTILLTGAEVDAVIAHLSRRDP